MAATTTQLDIEASSRHTASPLPEEVTLAAGQPGSIPPPPLPESSPQGEKSREPTEGEVEYPEGGRTAWATVAGCACMAWCTMGFGQSWGVFQSYYKENTYIGISDAVVTLLGSLQSVGMTFTSYFAGSLADQYGYKPLLVIGGLLNVTSLILAAFSTKAWQTGLTQGLLQGISSGLCTPAFMSSPSQWFKKRRGTATGIALAGSGIGGGVNALVADALLSRIGIRYTLLVFAGFQAILCLLGVLLITTRFPSVRQLVRAGKTVDRRRRTFFDLELLKDSTFWSVFSAVLVSVFTYTLPFFFLPQYALEHGSTPSRAALLSSILNFATGVGRALAGIYSDWMGPLNSFFLSIFVAGLTQLLVWTFAEKYAVTMLFAVLYGLIGPVYMCLTTVVAASLFGVKRLATVTGMLLFANAPGNLAGNPIGGLVLESTNRNWKLVAIYAGSIQAAGGLLVLYARFKRQPKLFAVF